MLTRGWRPPADPRNNCDSGRPGTGALYRGPIFGGPYLLSL